MRVSKLTRILSLLLVFVLGFLSCIASIVGAGYIAASKISLDKLKEWGYDTGVDKYISPDAEVSLTAMTLIGLIQEIDVLSKIEGELTVGRLLDRYGLKLTEETNDMLPPAIMSVDVRKVFSRDGIEYILANTTADYILKFVPADVLSAPMKDAIADKSLKDIIDGNLTYIFEDVYLGYLTGVEYQLQENGEYKVIFANPDEPTIMELVAPLSIANVLDALTNNGDILGVLASDIGDVMVESLIGSVASLDSMPGLLEGTKLADVLKQDEETGSYKFDFMAALEGKTIGDIMGYEPVYLSTSPTASTEPLPSAEPIIIGWKEADGKDVTGIMRGIAGAKFDVLFSGEDMDIDSMIEGAYLGDVLGYVPIAFDESGVPIEWETADGGKPDAILSSAVNKSLGDMMSGSFEVNTLFDGKYVGDAMGYYKSGLDNKWYEDEAYTKELIGINSIIADIDIAQLMAGDDYDVAGVFDGKLGGDLFGYKKTYVGEKIVWLDSDDKELKGTDKAIANLEIGKLIDSEASYDIADAFSDLYLGELLGYELKDVPESDPPKQKWWDEETADFVGELEQKLSDYNVGKIMKGEADLSSDSIIEGLTLADIMGYTKKTFKIAGKTEVYIDVWYDGDTKLNGVMSVLADKDVDGIATAVDSIKIGDVLGYYWDTDISKWCEVSVNTEEATLTPASGLILNMANLTISELNNSETVNDTIKGIKISEIMGYYKEGDIWYTDASKVEELTGIMKVLAEKTVKELDNNVVDTLTLAEVMGFKKVEGVWYDGANEVTGIMGILAETKIPDINTRVSSLPLGEVMGYHRATPDSEWLDKENKPITGVMKAFADLTVNEMSDSNLVTAKIQTVQISDILGYYKGTGANEGKWYTSATDQKPETEVTGIMAVIADSEVGHINDKVKTITVAEVLGYYHENPQDPTSKLLDSSGKEVDGIMAAIADFKLDELNSKIPTLKFSQIIGSDADNGVLKAFKDLTIDDMQNSEKVSKAVQGITIADAMGYKNIVYALDGEGNNKTNDKGDYIIESCEDSSGNPVTGVLLAIAGSKVSNLNTAVDDITLGALFGETAFNTGFLMLLDPDTKLKELNGNGENSLTNTFKKASVNRILEADLLKFGSAEIETLNKIDIQYANFIDGVMVRVDGDKTYVDSNKNNIRDTDEIDYGSIPEHRGGWRYKSLQDFIPYIINGIPYLVMQNQ